jgi:hypothetical protein
MSSGLISSDIEAIYGAANRVFSPLMAQPHGFKKQVKLLSHQLSALSWMHHKEKQALSSQPCDSLRNDNDEMDYRLINADDDDTPGGISFIHVCVSNANLKFMYFLKSSSPNISFLITISDIMFAVSGM